MTSLPRAIGETITLGGRSFALRPLTLGRLRQLLDGLDAMNGKPGGGGLIEAAAQIIHAALLGGDPALSREDVLGMEATMDEVNGAVAAIIRVAGLVRPPEGQADLPAGEASPVAGSAPSTAPSPPAVATPTPSSTP